jgi:hypothetical protein
MCTITNKIKLCSCKANSTEKLQHYWALYRKNKDNDFDMFIVGEAMLPSFDFFHPEQYEKNYATLANRVNEGDVFDVPMVFKAKDVLELVFYNKDDSGKRATYGFKYIKKQWIKSAIDPFDLMGRFEEVQFGKIKK